MKIGKLTDTQLQQYVFSRMKPRREEVLIGPGTGEDCGVIDFGREVCVFSTDPITAASKRAGKLAVLISCNDAASAGAEPIGLLITLLAPPSAQLSEITEIIGQAVDTAQIVNVDIVGGHTEVTDAVNRVVLSTTVLAKAEKERVVTTSGALAGDDIVMTKWAGLEGSCILAHDYVERCREVLDERELLEGQNLERYISVLPEGLLCADYGVHAMHDITEGGVQGAVWEMASASGTGAYIDRRAIPVLPVTQKLCAHFHLNPYALISSGSMLIACPDGNGLCAYLKQNGIPAAVIGKMVEQSKGVRLQYEGGWAEIGAPEADEIYRV